MGDVGTATFACIYGGKPAGAPPAHEHGAKAPGARPNLVWPGVSPEVHPSRPAPTARLSRARGHSVGLTLCRLGADPGHVVRVAGADRERGDVGHLLRMALDDVGGEVVDSGREG